MEIKERCYNKIVSESNSKEGIQFRKQHIEIPYHLCVCCDGIKGYNCPYYVVRHSFVSLSENQIDKIGRLEEIGEIDERFKIINGGLGN